MSDAPAKPPCCVVGARADAADIDAMLRDGMTHRAVATHFDALNPTAVYRHKAHVSIDGTKDGTRLKQPETPASPKATIPLPVRATKSDRTMKLIPPSPGDDPETSPRKLITAELENQAVQMRVSGKPWEAVADRLGLSVENAFALVERCLMRTNAKTNKNIESLRAIEVRRCEALIESLWDRATDPEMAECEVPADTESGVKKYDGQDKANAAIHKQQERLAKLLGLDAPTGPTVQINVLQDPAVLGMQRVQAAILDHLCPGVSQLLADGFEAYRTHGTAGLGRFIEDQLRQREAITVEAEPADAEDHPQ